MRKIFILFSLASVIFLSTKSVAAHPAPPIKTPFIDIQGKAKQTFKADMALSISR